MPSDFIRESNPHPNLRRSERQLKSRSKPYQSIIAKFKLSVWVALPVSRNGCRYSLYSRMSLTINHQHAFIHLIKCRSPRQCKLIWRKLLLNTLPVKGQKSGITSADVKVFQASARTVYLLPTLSSVKYWLMNLPAMKQQTYHDYSVGELFPWFEQPLLQLEFWHDRLTRV